MSPQRSTHFEAKVKEIWGLGNMSFFLNFPGTPFGETDKEMYYDFQEALRLSLP